MLRPRFAAAALVGGVPLAVATPVVQAVNTLAYPCVVDCADPDGASSDELLPRSTGSA